MLCYSTHHQKKASSEQNEPIAQLFGNAALLSMLDFNRKEEVETNKPGPNDWLIDLDGSDAPL